MQQARQLRQHSPTQVLQCSSSRSKEGHTPCRCEAAAAAPSSGVCCCDAAAQAFAAMVVAQPPDWVTHLAGCAQDVCVAGLRGAGASILSTAAHRWWRRGGVLASRLCVASQPASQRDTQQSLTSSCTHHITACFLLPLLHATRCGDDRAAGGIVCLRQ